MALKQLKNNKAAGEDGITSELLKVGGTLVLKVLQRLFNSVLFDGTTPEAWNRGVVVLFFKKGDKTLLKNYRPISLLSHVYKLFSRVITNRLLRAGLMTSSLPNKPVSVKAIVPQTTYIRCDKLYRRPRSIICHYA